MLLDTNVISELRKGSKCNPSVQAWQGTQELEAQYLSVITLLELALGIELAARRDPEKAGRLASWYEQQVKGSFKGRVLPVDTAVAEVCARLHAIRPRPYRDALIAATARVHGLSVATRNVADFEETGVTVVNPWGYEG